MADVQAVIRERIAEIESERRKLEAVLAELISEGRKPHRRKRAGLRTTRTSSRRGRKPGERRKQVLAYLKRNPGARASDVAGSINASPNQVNAVIDKLRKEKLVIKRGKGYGLAKPTKAAQGS